MIESYVPGRKLTFVRNPNFRVWSRSATPEGFPDEIEFRLGLSADAAVTAVARGQADLAMGLPADRVEEVETRHASQLHLNPAPGTMFFLFLNTRLPPFNDVRVRRAVNYAVDRAAVAPHAGRAGAGRAALPDPPADRRRLPALLPLHRRPEHDG